MSGSRKGKVIRGRMRKEMKGEVEEIRSNVRSAHET